MATEKRTTQPTPGPWTCRPNVLTGDFGVLDIVRKAPGPLARVFVATLHNEADARLIAAAPEMMDYISTVAGLDCYQYDKYLNLKPCGTCISCQARALLATIEDTP